MPVPMLSKAEIDYPSSDGKPMAETDTHVDAIMALKMTLDLRFKSRSDVYVAANNLIYYEEGNRDARFSPDVYVVFGVKKKRRRVYKTWSEKKSPSIVFEASSKGTWLEDLGNKRALCQRLNVKEYVLFDPELDYLKPPLQGYRLLEGQYIRIEPDSRKCLHLETLGLKLHLSDTGKLTLIDPKTGEALPDADALDAIAQKATAELRRESRARREAEAEVARLKEELKRLKQ